MKLGNSASVFAVVLDGHDKFLFNWLYFPKLLPSIIEGMREEDYFHGPEARPVEINNPNRRMDGHRTDGRDEDARGDRDGRTKGDDEGCTD